MNVDLAQCWMSVNSKIILVRIVIDFLSSGRGQVINDKGENYRCSGQERAKLEALVTLALTEMREQWLLLREAMLGLGFDETSAFTTVVDLLRSPPVVDDASPDPVEQLLTAIKREIIK